MLTPNMDISDFAGSSYHQSPPGRKGGSTKCRRVIDPPMSARQNKKHRKGRNSANNRERTVTTLTEDPNTPYLVPTPSEEPPGGHLSAHLGGKGHTAPMGSQPYKMSANFGGYQGYPPTFNPQQPYFSSSQSQTMQQQKSPQQYQPTASLPPGKNDLEILQNLKQLILDNQHPIFRPLPQPAALAKLYKGAQLQVGLDSGESSSVLDSASLATRRQSKDSSSAPQQSASTNPYRNSSGENGTSNTTALVHRVGKSVSGSGAPRSVAAGLPSSEERRYDYSTHPVPQKADSGDRPEYPSNGFKKQPSLDDPMDGAETHGNRDSLSRPDGWTSNQPPVYSESGRPESDRTPTHRGGAVPLPMGGSGYNGSRSTVFDPPGDNRNREKGGPADARGWNWQDRNHRRPGYDRPLHHGRQQGYRARRVSSASDHHRPMVDDPPIRRGGPVVESHNHVPIDSKGPSTDVMRFPAASDRPVHESDESVADSKRSVDYLLHSDARVPPLSSRIEGVELVSSTLPSDSVGSRTTLTAPSGLASPDASGQDHVHPLPRQSVTDTAGGMGGDSHGPPSRANTRPSPYHGFNKKKFQKHPPINAGPNIHGPATDSRPGQGRPQSPSLPPSGTNRPVPRSSSVDGRRGRFPSPVGGPRGWDQRGPPSGRDISRDRPPASYRGDYDPDINIRYGERPYGRDYSPPPGHGPSFASGERGPPGTYTSASVPQGRDWNSYPTSYPPGNRREWGTEDEAYIKSRTWEGRPPPPPSERDRYEYPPRSANWVDRDYPGRDSYPTAPPPPVEDRYIDRGRPAVYPPYNRTTRPRSPTPPLRRGGPDSVDDRPPVKRPREEYDPADYYPPPTPANRRGGHPPGEFSHSAPPRAPSPVPPGSGPSWPPPSSGSTTGPSGGAGLPADRDYRYPPPVSGGYDRPRSPGPPRGRPPYSRGGGYGRNAYPPRP